jgi:ABC-type branched-subunit amino acid transport system substrate-binding protein
MMLGPVFAGEVAAVAPAGPASRRPGRRVFLGRERRRPRRLSLSFLPSDDANRIVSYAASQGRRSFAALIPANAYGAVMEAAFRSAVAAGGGRIIAIETYGADPAELTGKVAAIAGLAPQIDALFIPDAGDAVPAIAASLAAAGVTRDKVKFLGSGQWDDPRVLNDPALVGSWFPAPAKQGFEGFAVRYQAAYGAPPPRNATLAYDGAVLAAGLARKFGAERFQPAVMASGNGFVGLDGLFRFVPSGGTERRLAVHEVTGSGARVVDPAGRSFSPGS